MIGKPEWFQRRKYSGWGIVPKTWQGYVYIAVMIIPLIFFHALPYWSATTKTIVTIILAVIFGIDVIDIMIRMKRDERERITRDVSIAVRMPPTIGHDSIPRSQPRRTSGRCSADRPAAQRIPIPARR